MKNLNYKLVLACVVAVLGVVSAGRLVWGSLPKAAPAPAERELRPAVLHVLQGGFDTVPTPDTVTSDIHRAAERVAPMVQSIQSPAVRGGRGADLAAAFEERLARIIDPDYERDQRAREARGQQTVGAPPDDQMIERIQKANQLFAMMPIDIQGLEVRPIYERGRLVEPSTAATQEGFAVLSVTMTDKSTFPMGDLDPQKNRLDIVEVRIPMEMPIPPPGSNTRERCLAGFQFVWSEDRQQWIPWSTAVYGSPNSGSFGLPF